jgi:hypothetical protein
VRDKRDGTEQTFNLKGELVQWVTPADGPIPVGGVEQQNQIEKGQESRDVGPPPPGRPNLPLELCCDSIKCLQCSRRGCPAPDYDCGGGVSLIISLVSLLGLSSAKYSYSLLQSVAIK